MSIINVLGSSSLIGQYFIDTNIDYEVVCFSRKNKNHIFLDLQDEDTFLNFTCENSFIVSFAPIWLVKDLISKLEEKNLKKLKKLKKQRIRKQPFQGGERGAPSLSEDYGRA